MEEIWRDITNFEGAYQISNMGRVKALQRPIYERQTGRYMGTRKERIKTPKTSPDGYKTVQLSYKDNNRNVSVHRLVCEEFIPNPDNLLEINHKDFNRTNNCVDNLEWVSHVDNIKYSADRGRYKNLRLGKDNIRSIPIRITKDDFTKEFVSKTECAKYLKETLCLKSKVTSIHDSIDKSLSIGRKYRGYTVEVIQSQSVTKDAEAI